MELSSLYVDRNFEIVSAKSSSFVSLKDENSPSSELKSLLSARWDLIIPSFSSSPIC